MRGKISARMGKYIGKMGGGEDIFFVCGGGVFGLMYGPLGIA